jgi:hypothetical protein
MMPPELLTQLPKFLHSHFSAYTGLARAAHSG